MEFPDLEMVGPNLPVLDRYPCMNGQPVSNQKTGLKFKAPFFLFFQGIHLVVGK